MWILAHIEVHNSPGLRLSYRSKHPLKASDMSGTLSAFMARHFHGDKPRIALWTRDGSENQARILSADLKWNFASKPKTPL